jgi:hypothetical protein
MEIDVGKVSMSKKIMVLALAVASATFFSLPAMASAQEIHFEPGEGFTASGGGGEFRISGEPTITCTNTAGSGKFDAGSTTTGSMTGDTTGCHTSVFGITASCKSEGAATGTIATSGTFHLITVSSGVPGVLGTGSPTKVICAGISTITVRGNGIATITAPKCGESSKVLTLSGTATVSTQNHLSYTGVTYDTVAKTPEGENRTAAGVGTETNTQANAGKLNCT